MSNAPAQTGPIYDALPSDGRLSAGTSFSCDVAYDDAPRSDGWTLALLLAGLKDSATIAATAGGSADSFALNITPETTAAWCAGPVAFIVRATSADTFTVNDVERGRFYLIPSPGVQTHTQKVLAALKAVELGIALDDQQTRNLDGVGLSYSLRDRPEELQKWLRFYESKRQREINEMAGRGAGPLAVRLRAGEYPHLAAPYPGVYR